MRLSNKKDEAMSERVGPGPDETQELLPGEAYDLEKIKENVRIKTDPEEKERFFGDATGHSTEELLTMGPEPFVQEYAKLYRKHLEHLEAVTAENQERLTLVENRDVLPFWWRNYQTLLVSSFDRNHTRYIFINL